ncbi:hypothetical protein [Paraburkholderia sp. J8-2]|uniref:hypothetical protein n=1 Tax=Paraburkholderia sp. J8-2 TaxID=2805440 RepID=UPI002AB6ADB1|nr:hypothetical protein [Paraburkholderia sp. J8-2]
MLDVRVAHAMSKAGVEFHLDDPKAILMRASAVVSKLLMPLLYRRPSARDLRRHADRVIIPELTRMRVSAGLSESSGTPFLHCVAIAGNESEGVSVMEFTLALACPKRGCFRTLVSMSPHAIARLIQRARFDSFRAAMPSIYTALNAATQLRDTFLDLGCIQAAVPAAGGLFVGDVLSDESLELGSWFVPGESNGHSRWDNLHRLMGNMAGSDGYLRSSDVGFDAELAAIDLRLRECPLLESRFPFLFQHYERRVNPLDERWRLARRQEQAQGQAAQEAA